MIRLGMLDFDTSHAVDFARRLNHADIPEEQWVEGARIVVACPGWSRMMPERIPGYTEEIRRLGIPLVERPEEMIGLVDGMFIESQQGSVHLERARPFLEAGLPCFIDKPFTCSLADAHGLVKLAAAKRVPIFSASSLRYAPGLVGFLADPALGRLHGALTYGPSLLHEGNPGLFHYVIHAVEILYTLLGRGCRQVSWVRGRDAEVLTAQWNDGRVAGTRGIRPPEPLYGFVAFTDQGVRHVPLDTTYIYRELLRSVVEMFRTGRPPLDPAVTVEMIAFLEAATRSAFRGGLPELVEASSP